MDTSDSDDMVDMESDESDEDWVESGKLVTKRRSKEKKFDVFDGGENTATENNGHICCSCSKHSSCKTKKCECRLIGRSCGGHCNCKILKCANREDSNQGLDDEKSMEMVSQGTLLLQSALQQRKPLSDIGNSQVCLSSFSFSYVVPFSSSGGQMWKTIHYICLSLNSK